MIIYEGPSELDGAPIVVIATGLGAKSNNAKTGGMVQTWILRSDLSPFDAANSGEDASVCGDCPHRGRVEGGKNVGRSCYVTLFQAPLAVWKTYKRGGYAHASPLTARTTLAGARVRLGSYGDPAAVPADFWSDILAHAGPCTGYTHQWRTCSPDFSRWCMASCDSSLDRELAKALGYRTFRVRAAGEAREGGEVMCPASAEAGFKTNCAACVACGGTSAKARADIVIVAHGSAAVVKNFEKRAA